MVSICCGDRDKLRWVSEIRFQPEQGEGRNVGLLVDKLLEGVVFKSGKPLLLAL